MAIPISHLKKRVKVELRELGAAVTNGKSTVVGHRKGSGSDDNPYISPHK